MPQVLDVRFVSFLIAVSLPTTFMLLLVGAGFIRRVSELRLETSNPEMGFVEALCGPKVSLNAILAHLCILSLACSYAVALLQNSSVYLWMESLGFKCPLCTYSAIIGMAALTSIPLTIVLQIVLVKLSNEKPPSPVLQTDPLLILFAFPVTCITLVCYAAKSIIELLKGEPRIGLEEFCNDTQNPIGHLLKFFMTTKLFLPARITFISYSSALIILWYFGLDLAVQPTTTAYQMHLVIAYCHLLTCSILALTGLTLALTPSEGKTPERRQL